ncbi:hypothetical protein MMC27_000124 [Xylographa pallens]|nr:hypothetical protein [Xylographa pallens]
MRFPSLHRMHRTRQPSPHAASPRDPTTHRALWTRALQASIALRFAHIHIADSPVPVSLRAAHARWLLDCDHTFTDAEQLLHISITSGGPAWWVTGSWSSKLYNRAMILLMSKTKLKALIARMEELEEAGEELVMRGRRELEAELGVEMELRGGEGL